jgi:predicted protein tyrosine phosphatase
MTNILFVCSQNKLRSPTAEAVFADVDGWNVLSAGLNNNAEVQLGAEDVEWADYIFVMENRQKKKLATQFRKELKDQRLICLGIPDDYQYMDPDLVGIFKEKVPKLVS